MNKELREDLKHLIICKDKTITQDLRDDIKMTLDYIDKLEEENDRLSVELNTCMIERNNLLDRIDKAIETLEKRIEENEEIDYVDMTGKSYINYQKEIIDILRGNDE